MRSLLAVALVLAIAVPSLADPPKKPGVTEAAILKAIEVLQKAAGEESDPKERDRLLRGIAALRKATNSVELDNHRISQIVDNRQKFMGEELTLKMTYAQGGIGLRAWIGQKAPTALFEARDPRNGALLRILLSVPEGIDVPNAVEGDELIVTFLGTRIIKVVRP